MVLGLVRIPAKPKIKSCAGSKRGHGSWTGSSHRSRSPLCRSWSRSGLAHSSRRAHSSWSRSLRSSQSSPWFWWVEGGVGQRSRWRERRGSVWGLRGREPLYTCRGRCDLGTWSLPGSWRGRVCFLLAPVLSLTREHLVSQVPKCGVFPPFWLL